MSPNELVGIEEAGWYALSSSGEAATAFYGEVLDRDVTMVLPGGMVLDDRRSVLESMSGAPWTAYELSDFRESYPSADVGVVVYRATARRNGSPEYSAVVSSTYVRRDQGWRLAHHQQTPV